MLRAYAAAGFTIASDRELYGLAPATASVPPDIVVHTRRPPPLTTAAFDIVYMDSDNGDASPFVTLARSNSRDAWRFEYADGTAASIYDAGSTIWIEWRGDFADACTYLVGPILGFAIRLKGAFAIHASAVDIGGAALAVAGPHGAGKSTIAAAIGRRGHPVLADDIVRVTFDGGRWYAHACGSFVRLWPEGAALACGSHVRLAPITPSWDKRALPIGGDVIPAAAPCLPLAAIVFLTSDDSAAPAPQRLAPGRAAIELAACTTAGYLLGAADRAREFVQLSDIAAAIPCMIAERPQLTDAGISTFLDHVRAHTIEAAIA